MKKITGKVVSLVLALALVVTSFSGISAFAYSKTVEGIIDGLAEDEIYLVNGGSGDARKYTVADMLGSHELQTFDRTQDVSDAKVSSISHSSGDSLVRWDVNDNGEVTFTLKDTGKSGKEVLSVLIKGTYTDDDDNKITVKAKKEYTVHVLDADQYVIAKAGQTKDSGEAGEGLDELDTFAQTAGSSQEFSVYQPKTNGTTDARATYEAVDFTLKSELGDSKPNNQVIVEISNDSNIHPVRNENNDQNSAVLYVGKKNSDDKYIADASTGNVTITATGYKGTDKDDDSKTTFKTKIDKKVDVSVLDAGTDDAGNANHQYIIGKASKGGATVLKKVKNPNLPSDSNDEVVVTNAEVVFPSETTSVNVEDKSNLQKISGTVGALTIGDASINSIDVKGSVNVSGDKASIGTIASKPDGTNAGVVVSNGKTGDITVKESGIQVTGGTVGNLETKKGTNDAGIISIEPDDDDLPISVGNITAKKGVEIKSNDSAKVSVGDIKLSDNSDVTLVGNKVTVKSIDFDYYTGKLLLGSTDEFVGTIPALKKADNAGIETQEEDTAVVVNGNVKVDSISVDDETSLTFTDKVNVNTIDGDGTLAVAAGKLYVDGSASGVTLKLTDANLANGMVAYTAKADALDIDDMNNFGFTVAKSAGNSIDTFKINGLTFAGVQVNKTSARIAKDYSETFTATAYPTGTTIPTDAKIAWELDGNDDVFQVTATGNTATVKVLKIDPDFASENEATLTAKLVDEDGDEIDDYASAEIALTAIAVPDAKSDTTTNFTVAQGASYTMKVTSATAPSVTLGTAGVFAVTTTKNGNDYFYKFVPTGKVGAATGVYLNGTKLLVASVGAPAFKSDTTVAIKVAAGKSYTYKITASAAPSFVFGTGNVFSVTKISKVGNDYFFTVAPVANAKSGAATGVYVNGVKVNVATVA